MATVAVLGGGVAGAAAALLLARDGHRVTLVERDHLDVGRPEDAPHRQRRGIPHYLQPHAVIPRGRVELRDSLPDVYAALLHAGASDVDVSTKLPGGATPTPADADLQYIAVRRPMIEWALRQALHAEAGIVVRDGAHVTGLGIEHGRVRQVQLDGGSFEADIVVDALGRRTPTDAWLGAERETSDCGVVYYSRYYRVRPGFELPDGPWLLSPRGDLGYLAYASFPGDNGTFAGLLAVPSGVPEWRPVGHVDAFEAAVARTPLSVWVDPAGVEPLTDVMPMAGLRNSLRAYDPAAVVGYVPVGDAYSHTDPVLAHGLAFALVHARELAAALRDHADVGDAAAAYAAATAPVLAERYRLATELDGQRHRMWLGGPVDPAHHDGDYALFSMAAAGAASTVDADVFRVFVRRIGLLDSTAVLDDDLAMQQRIEQIFAGLPPRPVGISRDEMLAVVGATAP